MTPKIEQGLPPPGWDKKTIARIESLDWQKLSNDLNTCGWAKIPKFLEPEHCYELVKLYRNEELFRSHIYLHRHGFGRGEYKYFRYPLPESVNLLRENFYRSLAPIANHWHDILRLPTRFPVQYEDFICQCHEAGQVRPTPLILRYDSGDYNCLHQDLYGENVFPFQLVILLSKQEVDFTGGEFVMTEQRPRMQSRVEVLPITQGDVLIFAVRYRPVSGVRGVYRVNMRHGVSTIQSGLRHTLGIIFHDAL